MSTNTSDAGLPELPEKDYLGDDASYGYDEQSMHAYARTAQAEAVAPWRKALEDIMPLARMGDFGGPDVAQVLSAASALLSGSSPSVGARQEPHWYISDDQNKCIHKAHCMATSKEMQRLRGEAQSKAELDGSATPPAAQSAEVDKTPNLQGSPVDKSANLQGSADPLPSGGDDAVLEQALRERDDYHDMADQLAAQIAAMTEQEIGEHSSANDPWRNALIAGDEFISKRFKEFLAKLGAPHPTAGQEEREAWKELFWQVALLLQCLPSSYIDGNEHVLKAAKSLSDVRAERMRQDQQWGGSAHDDEHDAGDWGAFIRHQLKRLVGVNYAESFARERFVKIAALAVAAVESIDRRATPAPAGDEHG